MSAPNSARSGDAGNTNLAPNSLIPTSEPALTLAAISQVFQDAAQFTAQYGSSAAARERLELLEREQEGLNDMIVVLRTRLRQSQRATAAAESEARRHKAALISAKAIATIATSSSSIAGAGLNSSSSGGGGGAGGKQASSVFDADAFVHFLKRRFACRGDMALLQDALYEFQTQRSGHLHHQQQLLHQQQARERVVLLTIEEVQTSIPSASSSNASYDVHVSTENNSTMNANTSINVSAGISDGINGGGNMGIGIPPMHSFYRQSPEEEEQEIHLAAKQLLSPVTFAHVEGEDEDHESKATPQAVGIPQKKTLVPILAHERQDNEPLPKLNTVLLRMPEEGEQKLKKILPKKPRVKKTPREASPPPPSSPAVAATTTAASASVPKGDPQEEGKSVSEPVSKKRKVVAEESLVIKQNLVWPAERRNITEMKHSSRFLALKALEELDKQTPWNEMYKRRPLYSHIINYSALDDRAKTWFVSTLKIQFIWRRELWERLHWLPMSESVCTGAAWEKYRQTRKRRAKHAVTAWRKIYAQSIQMIEAGILPDDIWCDPALWYMPANPIYWLPESDDVVTELAAIDEKHAVRCYHVYDLTRHPFYEQGLIEKYPQKFELPSFSSITIRDGDNTRVVQTEEWLKDTPLLAADVVATQPPPKTAKLILAKDATSSKKRGPRAQKVVQKKVGSALQKVKTTGAKGGAAGSEPLEGAKAS